MKNLIKKIVDVCGSECLNRVFSCGRECPTRVNMDGSHLIHAMGTIASTWTRTSRPRCGGLLSLLLSLLLALPAAADVKSTSYLTTNVTSVADIEKTSKLVSNITWDDANKCAVFNGQASYIQIENPLKGTTLNTGFTIKMEAYISNENNSSGQYTARDGSKKNKNGWQRLFDLSDDTTSHYLFLNAGSSGHLKVAACYGSESWRKPSSTWYDNWYTYELIMAPGGYMTLYVDGTPVVYLANDDKVKSLMGMIDDLNICYLGTSVYEFRTTTNTDGFLFGKMRNVQFLNEPTRPAWDGSGFLYRLLYDSCGSTDPAAITTKNVPATLPSMSETGYSFGGWFKDKAYTQPAVTGEALTSNTTLYAKWEPALHSHCVCGDGECTVAGHTHKTLVWQPWTSTTTLPATAGNYYLANDVTLSATYTPPTGVNLCLNGHVVNGNGACTLVKLNGGAAFTLTDCDKTTTHNFSVDANGLWTLTDTAKTVDYEDLTARPNAGDVVALTGGALTGGYINDYGTGGVWVNGVFTMYGGNLVGNRNMAKHGGAIYIGQNNSYSVTLAGGRICGNSAAGCGGAVQQDGSCVSNLRLCGADVSFNAAGNKGGAVNSDSAVTVTGGRIAYNKAAGLGSAMSLTASSASVSMTGGSITHNESSESGSCGAVYFAGSSSYVIGGTLLLDENYTAGNERNLYLAAGKTVAVSTTTPLAEGAQIGVTTETAPAQGGYVAVTDATGAGLSKYFTSDNPAYTVMNIGNPVVLAIPSKYYVSATGNDSNAGTVAAPLKTLAAAYNKITSVGTIALLSDIDVPAGSSPALSVTGSKSITVTSANAEGVFLDNAEGDYTGVYTIHRANNTSTMLYLLNGNLTLKQVVVSGDAKNFAYAGSYGQGFLIFAPGNGTMDDTLSLGVNCILRDNIDVGNNGAACGGGVTFGTENCARNPKMYMSANATIIGCIAPRHGGAITMYDGDLYMSDNATLMYNGVEFQPAYGAYYGGGAILAYRGHVHMTDNATVTKNYVQLNGGSDSGKMHNSMQIDPATASIGYVSGNARIFDNYDDGHLTRNADGSYTLVGTKQANAYADAGKFYVDGVMGEDAKIGVTVKSAALNSVVANGTSAYAVTSADANKFFDDTGTYKVMKHATANQLIFGSSVVSTTLTLDSLTTTLLTGTFGAAIGATASDFTVFKDGVKMESGYTITVNGTALSIAFDPALIWGGTIGVAVSKNGYKINDGKVVYLSLPVKFNVAFQANHADVTCGGATFSSTNVIFTYGSPADVPALACGDLVFAGWAKTAGATTPDYRTAEEVSTMSTVSGSSHTLYAVWADKLVLGEFAPLTQTFPDAVATADPGLTYKQVTLMFTREMSGETFVLPTGAEYLNYVKNTDLSTAYSCVIDLTTAQTAAEIATNYLRQVKFRGCVNQELRVVLGPKTSYKTFYFDETKHYYQYVPYKPAQAANVRKWTDAYETAKGMAFAGRQGYLATIANQDEDLFVYEASGGVIGWLGATSMNHGEKSGLYYASFTDTNSGAWYWACGPECGEQFFDCIIGDATSYARNAAANYYFNWRQNGSEYEPNNQPASGYGYAGERCLTTLPGRGCSTFGILGEKYSWNDIPVQNYTDVLEGYAAVGFIVEFGDKKVGDTSEPDEGEVASGVRGYAIAVADIVAPYVEFNAWGGYHGDDPTCEVTSNVCVDGVYSFPRFAPTRAGEYTFVGWYESWTNGAAQAVEGNVMFVQGPHKLYAKWISPSTPAGEGTNTLAYASITNEAGEVVGDGAILVGATNKLLTTDLAVPEFTSNGADGKPYEIIAKKAFAYANYDKKVAAAERLTSVTISTYVTNIQEQAFRDCRVLSNVTFSATRDYRTGEKTRLVIDDWAFQGSTVKEIRFPADCTVDLQDGAFADTKNLTDIYLLGDVKVEAKYPFRGAGFGNYDAVGNQVPVNLHLSAKLAADPAFVYSLTNGMSAARIVLSQQIEGEITDFSSVVTSDPMVFTFKVASDSPWLKVSRETVYLFYSKTLDDFAVGTGKVLHPDETPTGLTGPDASGRYRAEFAKPSPDAGFFKLCIGDSW